MSLEFNDGHVGVSGGDFDYQYQRGKVLGGYGFAVRELDDGRVIVVYVLPGGPADRAGMRWGRRSLTTAANRCRTALEKVVPFQPQSTDFGLRYEQTVFLTRGGIGERRHGDLPATRARAEQTVEMTPSMKWTACSRSIRAGADDEFVLPSEYEVLPSGAGLHHRSIPIMMTWVCWCACSSARWRPLRRRTCRASSSTCA